MARALRVLRAECNNPSQEEVSRLGNCSKSSISPALNAECLPTETVVRAIVSGCLRFAERSDDEVRRAEERLCALWHDLKVQEGGRKARPASADVDVATPLPPARQTRQRRPRLVVATAAVALVAALLGSHLYLDEVRDRLRGGDDFSVATEIVQLGDEGFTTATREPYSLSQEQRRRMREPGALADPGPFIETVRADGGAAAGDLTIRLTLRGRRHQSLRITNIRFDVIDREAPHNGTLFHIPPQGEQAAIEMIATLDHRNHPALHEMEIDPETREPSPGRQYFGSRTVALSNGGTQVFTMRATASCDYVAFNLKIAYEIDGERQEPRIVTNRGRPFEITGFSQQPPGVGSYQQVYDVQDDHSLGPAADPRHYDLGNVGSCEPA